MTNPIEEQPRGRKKAVAKPRLSAEEKSAGKASTPMKVVTAAKGKLLQVGDYLVGETHDSLLSGHPFIRY